MVQKRGWVYAFVDNRKIIEVGFLKSFKFLGYPTLVDIPIGLPETRERLCDKSAKKMLSKRASCIFSVPCRKAVYQESYKKALTVNREIQNKGFSKQFWNIAEKVRELDSFLRENVSLRSSIRESQRFPNNSPSKVSLKILRETNSDFPWK